MSTETRACYDELKRELASAPKTWLITGVAGFIGSNLLETLLKLGQKVVGLDNFATGHRHNLDEVHGLVGTAQWARFKFITGDICSLADCQKGCAGVDYVLHQAAIGSVPRSLLDPIATNALNIDGFLNMLVAARDAKVARFVYAASSSIYGDHPGLPKVEDAIGRPLSPYAVTKYVNELYAEVFARCYGFESIGLRYFNVFGPRQDPNGTYAAVIPKWTAAMIAREPIYINGDGETSRDFTFVDNAVQINLRAATSANAQAINQVFNVAVGDRTTLNKLYAELKRLLTPRYPDLAAVQPIYRDFRAGDVRHSQADVSKAQELLGYQTTHSFSDGLRATVSRHLSFLSTLAVIEGGGEFDDRRGRGCERPCDETAPLPIRHRVMRFGTEVVLVGGTMGHERLRDEIGISASGSVSTTLQKFKSSSLIRGSATYLLSNVLSAAAPFLLMPVLARYLHPEEYGRIAMFQVAQAIFATVIGLSVIGSVGRKYYDANLSREEFKYFIGSCFFILTATTMAALAVLIGFDDAFVTMSGMEGSWLIAAALCAALGVIQQMLMTLWQVQKRSSHYAAMQIGGSVCLVALSLFFVIALAKGAEGRVIAQVISSLVVAVLALGFLHKDRLLGFAWRPAYIREALNFGSPLIPHSIGILLFGFFDRIVINDQLGLAEAGAYTVAVQVVSVFGLVTFAINNAYVPWLFERLQRDDSQEKQEIVKWTYWYFVIALGLAGGVFVVGPFAIKLFAGERYGDAGSAVGWLALTQAFAGMYLMVTNYVFYSKKTGLVSLVTISCGALNAVLLFALTSRFGLAGAGMAGAMAMAARFLLTWRVAQMRHPMPWFNLKTA